MHNKIKELIKEIDFDDKVVVEKMEEAIDCFFGKKEEKDEKAYEHFYWLLYEKMYGKHFSDSLVRKAISEMQFVNPDYKPKYSKEQIKSALDQAYRLAEQNYAKRGMSAPKIKDDVTMCDMEYVFNMISADYGLTHSGDVTKISLMSYEFLSDPDAPEGKAYLYYCAMSD